MNAFAVDADRIAAAIADLRGAVRTALDRRGPVPLATYFAETELDHVELPTLTRGTVAGYLQERGIAANDLGDPEEKLAGFVFAADRVGWAFVSGADIIARRRFTAAHELGHFVLHRETMGRFRADTDKTLQEADGDVADRMEREANRFAAELLMPEDKCRARAAEMMGEYGCCPRGELEYRLAAELLVSRQAIRYRLNGLGVGDE